MFVRSPALKCAVLGKHVEQSLSPTVHQALFPILRERTRSEFSSMVYEAISCPTSDDVLRWITEARRSGFHGANVTNPYKALAVEAATSCSTLADQMRSANTLTFNSAIRADSTDGQGFLNALYRRAKGTFAGFDLIVLGAGGAARAVLAAMREVPFESRIVAVRDRTRAKLLSSVCPDARVVLISELTRSSRPCFVVQATPVGTNGEPSPIPGFGWHARDVAYELRYRPITTRFLAEASEQGAVTIDGLGMLIEQAALSQTIWMTSEAPTESPLTDAEFFSVWERCAERD